MTMQEHLDRIHVAAEILERARLDLEQARAYGGRKQRIACDERYKDAQRAKTKALADALAFAKSRRRGSTPTGG